MRSYLLKQFLSLFGLASNLLPDFVITNIQVEHVGNDWVEFDSLMEGSEEVAYILSDIQYTGRRRGFRRFPIFRAKIVDESAISRKVEAEDDQEKVLFYTHGFNVPPRYVMNECAEYARDYNRMVIPLIWAAEDRGVFGYGQDRLLNAPTAAEAFRDKLDIAKHIRKSLLCHSMGNYVLRLAARTDAQHRPFEDIFMVAADVNHDIFDESQNNHTNHTLNDGLEIASMAQKEVHVLHSHKDLTMKARRFHWATGGV
jgi:esterase/lipase superfamily enzyme